MSVAFMHCYMKYTNYILECLLPLSKEGQILRRKTMFDFKCSSS
jgi:hypothetical protein